MYVYKKKGRQEVDEDDCKCLSAKLRTYIYTYVSRKNQVLTHYVRTTTTQTPTTIYKFLKEMKKYKSLLQNLCSVEFCREVSQRI